MRIDRRYPSLIGKLPRRIRALGVTGLKFSNPARAQVAL